MGQDAIELVGVRNVVTGSQIWKTEVMMRHQEGLENSWREYKHYSPLHSRVIMNYSRICCGLMKDVQNYYIK
jgi:hypothetical protein